VAPRRRGDVGIAALVAAHRWVNDGLEQADSYCTNPHKWMGVNFDCDLFWTADRRRCSAR
jgi:aromatic-L-amino-acid decarboxylase